MIRCLLALVVAGCGWHTTLVHARGVRDRLEGLVFEAEQWSEPKDAWLKDGDTPDHWNLWTKEQDVWKKRSMGASLRSPVAEQDRASPEEGAPPLHTRIRGIPPGTYRACMNNPGRRIAYSFDGNHWHRGEPRAEIDLGVFDIREGTFELWVDDRFATPSSIGPCYYDYIRLEPWSPPALSAFQAHRLHDDRVQVSWISDKQADTGVLEADTGSGFAPVGESAQQSMRNHRVWVSDWQPGQRVRVRVRIRMGRRYVFKSPPVRIKVPAEIPERSPQEKSIPLRLASPPFAERPVLAGLPLPPGQLWHSRHAWIEDRNGPVPSQVSVAARWPDGSVRWLFVRFLPNTDRAKFHLRLGTTPPEMTNPFQVQQRADSLTLSNGYLRLQFRRESFALFGSVDNGEELGWTGEPMLGNVRIVDAGGMWGLGPPRRLLFEETGPVRAVVLAEGPLQDEDGKQRFRYRLRYFLTANSPLLRVQLTLINDASEPVFQPLESYALRIPLARDGPLRGQLAGTDAVTVTGPGQNEIQQVTDKRLRSTISGQTAERNARSLGWAVIERGGLRVALALRDFWQTWPKGLALKPDGLHLRILPQLAPDEYRPKDVMDWARHLQWFKDGRYLFKRGMALRTEFWVRFDRTDDPIPQGNWDAWAESVQTLAYAAADPEVYCGIGTFGLVEPAGGKQFGQYEDMVARNFELVLKNRENRAEYGWMNFGDWHGERGLNWGNSEYDLAWAMALQFARTGRWDYFALGEQMARHHSTIDTVHAAWSARMPGRVYAHSIGHVGAGIEPREAGLQDDRWDTWLKRNRYFARGAIDPGGHIYQEGNFAYHFLTGDRGYLEAAEMVAAAQAEYLTARFDFGIERSAGWPLINAVAAYEATGNPFYLNAARLYVERILEKQDPVGGGWLLPQDRSECDHPPPHLGGKSFATGVLLYGMMRYDLIEPRDEVKRSIIRACEWLVDQAWNVQKQGFRYKTGCSKYADSADSGTTMALCAAGLAYGWTLKPDPRFREVLALSFARMCKATGGIGKQATQLTRQSAYALPVLRRMGRERPPSLTTVPSL